MCLLLTPMMSPLIIWLAEMLLFLRKIHFLFKAVFQDPAQLVQTIASIFENFPWEMPPGHSTSSMHCMLGGVRTPPPKTSTMS